MCLEINARKKKLLLRKNFQNFQNSFRMYTSPSRRCARRARAPPPRTATRRPHRRRGTTVERRHPPKPKPIPQTVRIRFLNNTSRSSRPSRRGRTRAAGRRRRPRDGRRVPGSGPRCCSACARARRLVGDWSPWTMNPVNPVNKKTMSVKLPIQRLKINSPLRPRRRTLPTSPNPSPAQGDPPAPPRRPYPRPATAP